MKRITTLVLAMLLLLSACSTADKPEETAPDETEGIETEVTETEERNDGRRIAPDTVPELDFEGADVTILCRSEVTHEFVAEEITGEGINDAIYNRDLYTEDRLKVSLSVLDMPGNWDSYSTFITNVSNSVAADDGAYDIIAYYAYAAPSLAVRGVLTDLKTIEYLNLQQPWWHADFERAATVNGKLYMHAGDIALTAISDRYAVFFNQDLLNSYLPEVNPYEMVFEGSWTTDNVIKMIAGIYSDLNFDGEKGAADFYAINIFNAMDAWYTGAGGTIMGRDADDNPVFDMYTEHNIGIIEQYYSLVNSVESYASNAGYGLFAEKRAIFSSMGLAYSESLRDFEDTYGVLPFPKWDETQKEYYSTIGDGYSQVMIPIDCKDIDRAGAVMEVMAAESYRSVTPAYFEIAMKKKYFRDEESAQMFDIIQAGAKYDFGVIYTSLVGDPVFIVRNSMTGGDFASQYNANIGKLNAYLKNVMKKFDALD